MRATSDRARAVLTCALMHQCFCLQEGPELAMAPKTTPHKGVTPHKGGKGNGVNASNSDRLAAAINDNSEGLFKGNRVGHAHHPP